MPLSPGTRLGPYEIAAQIGAGGMGEVYRATDTTLARQVAIKVLPTVFSQDPERLARFEREAKTLAALNHPHIAQIYGLEISSGMRALVMEFVEGEDLSQRIARGPIPLDDALPIARQMAEALEVAHEQGIVHRDLKPANIKVTPDGVVKVLDFGLAKLTQVQAVATPAHVTESPTITSPAMLTGAGMILGTAAYMSPEQAAGRPADKRSDVWAFGVVLYEMLTGKRAFDGGGVSETLAAVLRGEPDWDALPATTPAPIDKLLRGCLQKDRKERVPDIAVARFEIKDALAMRGASRLRAEGLVAATEPRPRWRRALPAAAAAVVTGALVGAVMWTFDTPLPPPPVTRFAFMLGEGQQFTNAGRQLIAISPDGAQMVYVANRQLFLRLLSDFQARPIPGTENAQGVSNPAFSPDGRSIAFWSAADRTLKTIAVSGGTAVMICPAENPTGMSWGEDGILFGGQGSTGIMRVPANGGQPELLIDVKDGELAYGPRRLPGSEWVMFTIGATPTAEGWDNAQIVVQSSKSGERRTLVSGGSDARYASTGHITYAVGGIIFAVPVRSREARRDR